MFEISLDEIYQINQQTYDSKYEELSILASGSFGTVKKAKVKKTGKIVAVKVLNKKNSYKNSYSHLESEINVLRQTDHKSIVKLYDFFETNNNIYIVMEYIENGTLKEYMEKNNNKITEKNVKKIMFYLLTAVEYLHKLNIVHKDLKFENIMFSNQKDLSSLKLIDFGLSTQFSKSSDKKQSDLSGTILYMAPEKYFDSSYSKEIDLWSIGIIMYMMLNNGIHPFYTKGNNKEEFFFKCRKDNIKYYRNISEQAKDLISHLLCKNKSLRYTCINALEHPWFSNIREMLKNNDPYDRKGIKNKAIQLNLLAIFMVHYKRLYKLYSKDNPLYINYINDCNKINVNHNYNFGYNNSNNLKLLNNIYDEYKNNLSNDKRETRSRNFKGKKNETYNYGCNFNFKCLPYPINTAKKSDNSIKQQINISKALEIPINKSNKSFYNQNLPSKSKINKAFHKLSMPTSKEINTDTKLNGINSNNYYHINKNSQNSIKNKKKVYLKSSLYDNNLVTRNNFMFNNILITPTTKKVYSLHTDKTKNKLTSNSQICKNNADSINIQSNLNNLSNIINSLNKSGTIKKIDLTPGHNRKYNDLYQRCLSSDYNNTDNNLNNNIIIKGEANADYKKLNLNVNNNNGNRNEQNLLKKTHNILYSNHNYKNNFDRKIINFSTEINYNNLKDRDTRENKSIRLNIDNNSINISNRTNNNYFVNFKNKNKTFKIANNNTNRENINLSNNQYLPLLKFNKREQK